MSSSSEPDEPQLDEVVASEPGRVRAAISVLRGQRLVPLQVQFEWLEYQQIFDDLLKRLSAQLARQARSEKARVKRLLKEPSETVEASSPPSSPSPKDPASYKQALRSRAAQLRGLPSAASVGGLANSQSTLPLELNGQSAHQEEEP